MGYSLSWLALKGGSLESICAATGLVSSGRFEDIPESEFLAAPLPTGWYVFLLNSREIPEVIGRELSAHGEVVGCFVEEHVMLSSASCWRNEKRIWHVEHYGGDKGVRHLETEGELPLQFEESRRELGHRQDGADAEKTSVDYFFEIPIKLAKTLTGFQHDREMPGIRTLGYEILEPPEVVKQSIAFDTVLSRIVRRTKHGAY